MPISLIAAVANYRGKLAIGKNGNLLAKLPADMAFFKTITSTPSMHGLPIVVMGRKTWDSIPVKFRPLVDRINIVLTNSIEKTLGVNIYYMTFEKFIKSVYLRDTKQEIFVIGGGEIYKLFMESNLNIDKMYITEITGIKFEKTDIVTYMPNFNYNYKLIGYSEKFQGPELISYRILRYKLMKQKTDEFKYLELANKILTTGGDRLDRTGTGTVSLFGEQLRFDISNGIVPLLTTKKVAFNMIIHELFWMMTGNTDAKVLQKNGVHIWDGNTSREFLDNRGLNNYPEGVLGAGYGWQIRFQGAKYNIKYADTSKLSRKELGKIRGFDQLKYIEDLLKNDPFSRRILMSYWNPIDFKHTSLLPCHFAFQFYVTEENGIKYLSGLLTQRSVDVFLGAPFNFVFYSTLIHIMCSRHNFKPKELVFSGGDVHLYKNHLDQIKEQMTRIPRPFPKIKLDQRLATVDWSEMKIEDIELIGYFPDMFIKANMAI